MPRFLVAGNWKMNGLAASVEEASCVTPDPHRGDCDIVICPPAPLLTRLSERLRGTAIRLGGQDCHPSPCGAHTGDHSAEMLADAGAEFVIVGHSERRQCYGETDDVVNRKVRAAWRAGLTAIVCVGESGEQRAVGQAQTVVGAQIEGSVPIEATATRLAIAYEPVWAIGTGRSASPDEITEMHDFVRCACHARLAQNEAAGMRLLYGGSVTPDNASTILSLPEVNGALVGGASLRASSFNAIIRSLPITSSR
ncbi:MAG: triose-phosphate isomerase [Rhodobacteraceae bacterium]|nr:triose-phosphate isomerase [Paracoccaceae bacterium]MCY4197494.1 triose-phosphate isomerase [Paracoccaceae bacterium]